MMITVFLIRNISRELFFFFFISGFLFLIAGIVKVAYKYRPRPKDALKDPAYFLEQALLLLQKGRYKKALKYVDEALIYYPLNPLLTRVKDSILKKIQELDR